MTSSSSTSTGIGGGLSTFASSMGTGGGTEEEEEDEKGEAWRSFAFFRRLSRFALRSADSASVSGFARTLISCRKERGNKRHCERLREKGKMDRPTDKPTGRQADRNKEAGGGGRNMHQRAAGTRQFSHRLRRLRCNPNGGPAAT
eukprot:g15575.t1